jgi:hypothetical protein
MEKEMNEKILNGTSAALAVIVILGLLALIALGQTPPGELWSAFGVVIGFFFGSGVGKAKA